MDQLREQLNDAISGGNVTPAADVVGENAVEADTCLLYTSCAHNAVSFDDTRERELANGSTRTVHVAAIDHDRCVGCCLLYTSVPSPMSVTPYRPRG